MLVGYARRPLVGSDYEHHSVCALVAAGCEVVFEEADAGLTDDQPELVRALERMSGGDVLVVNRLAVLGRAAYDLFDFIVTLEERGIDLRALEQNFDTACARRPVCVVAVMTEFARELHSERTNEGVWLARSRGRRAGPRRRMTAELVARATELYQGGDYTVQQIADELGVARNTIYTHVRRAVAPSRRPGRRPRNPPHANDAGTDASVGLAPTHHST